MSEADGASSSVTKQDLDAIEWRDVVDSCPTFAVHSIAEPLMERAKSAEAEGDDRSFRAYALLANCVFLQLVPHDVTDPLQVIINFGVRRSASLSDVADQDVDALIALATEINQPDVRARIADVAWELRRHYPSALVAVDAYLDTASTAYQTDDWVHARDYVERALHIAYRLGKGGLAQQQRVVSSLLAAIEAGTQNATASLLPAHAMELLLKVGEGEAAQLKSSAESMADRAFSQGGMGVENAEWYWRLAARWTDQLGEAEESKRLNIRAALAWADIAEQYTSQHRNYLTAANYLLRSYTALRRLGAVNEARALAPRLLEIQTLAQSEMKIFSNTIDLTPIIEEMESKLSGTNLAYDLSIMTAGIAGLSRQSVEDLLRSKGGDSLLNILVGSRLTVDHRGRVLGQRSGRDSSNPSEPLMDEAYHESRLYREVIAFGQIDTARRIINRNYRLTEYQLIGALTNSPFVPPGHELIFARGITRGFAGDYVSACSILVPQLEVSIRFLMEERSLTTYRIDPSGIQEDLDLNSLLYSEHIESILSEDLVFDLRGLLVSRFGSNLRNRLAHGLMRDGDFFTADAIYSWWIVVKLCFFGFAVAELGWTEPEPTTDE